jgi:hypothetical protein
VGRGVVRTVGTVRRVGCGVSGRLVVVCGVTGRLVVLEAHSMPPFKSNNRLLLLCLTLYLTLTDKGNQRKQNDKEALHFVGCLSKPRDLKRRSTINECSLPQ